MNRVLAIDYGDVRIGLAMSDLIVGGTSTNIDISELTLSRFSKGKTLKSRYKMKVLA